MHERAFRLGIYTLLLLSGKNLVPLVSAEIIQALSWRAVFWYAILVVFTHTRAMLINFFYRIVAAVAALCLVLMTVFLPETFWDRTASSTATQPLAEEKNSYTHYWRHQPPKSFTKSLTIFPGRLSDSPYHLIIIRPFILFAYPSIAWASLTYACSVGWLIVLSESISHLYRNRETYDFTALQCGLVYLSAFIGGVLGTAVAGKASDFAVKSMAKRNGGVYEPEFRLVMIVPVAICSVAGLMGFGWSIEVKDTYMVPTVFFGLIGFGCSLGSTVAISYAVDCYREFAGEALVTLNFSKSKFFPSPSCVNLVLPRLDVVVVKVANYKQISYMASSGLYSSLNGLSMQVVRKSS